jgi:hypothetical protein
MALGDLLTNAPAALVDNRASAREEEDCMLVRTSPTSLIRGFEEGRGQKPMDEIDQVARGMAQIADFDGGPRFRRRR